MSGTIITNTGMIYSLDDSSKTISGSIVSGNNETTYTNNSDNTSFTISDTDLTITKTTNSPTVTK